MSVVPRAGIRKVTVVANCHAGPISQLLAFHGLDLHVDGIYLSSWHDPGSDVRQRGQRLLHEPGTDDLVFSFNVTGDFDSLETSRLKRVYGDRLITFTNIRFDGLHPDATFLGSFAKRWVNFLPGFHSKIVVHSYAAGRSARECLALFNGQVYDKLGYYDIFACSESELRLRDRICEVKLCDMLFDLVPDEYCLMTPNHPTSVVFSRMVKMLCDRAGITFVPYDERMFPNPLMNAPVWPIFNEIAEHFRLRYRTPQYFVRGLRRELVSASLSISLEEFINASYDFYDKHYPRPLFVKRAAEMDEASRFSSVIAS